MLFEVNSQVTYIELEENDVNRRYIMHNFEGIPGKILNVIKDNPKVHLVRTGYATITSAPDTNTDTVSGLQSIPSTVNAVYTIQIMAHPVLGTGLTTARYSDELTQLVANAESVVTETPVAVAAPQEPKVDLTAQLKAQMLAKKQEEFARPTAVPTVITEPVTPSVPIGEPLPGQTEVKFEDFITQKKAEQAIAKPSVNKALKPQPTGKIDILMEMVAGLSEEVEELRAILTEMRSGLGV